MPAAQIIALATTAVVASAIAAYFAYYTVKYGKDASTPLESWITARRHRDSLDKELAKILGDKESS
jgi:hypothetical protein